MNCNTVNSKIKLKGKTFERDFEEGKTIENKDT